MSRPATGRLLGALALTALMGSTPLAQAAPAKLDCRLSSKSCITTFLLAGPFEFSLSKPFSLDHLSAFGGERAIRPSAGTHSAGEQQLRWEAHFSSSNFVEVTERCRPLDQSVFYLSCDLHPQAEQALVGAEPDHGRLELAGRGGQLQRTWLGLLRGGEQVGQDLLKCRPGEEADGRFCGRAGRGHGRSGDKHTQHGHDCTFGGGEVPHG